MSLNLSIDWIKPLLLSPNLSEDRLVSLIKETTQVFTINRTKINSYQYSQDQVSAYTAFYFLTNFPKLKFIFNLLPKNIVDAMSDCVFVDIGSGPGTYSSAYLDLYQSQRPLKIIAIDKSELMLEQAKKIIEGLQSFYRDKKIEFHATNKIPILSEKKIFFFGHSLNEMGIDYAFDLIKEHSPEYVFFIEPGTKKFFIESHEFKKKLIDFGFSNVFPCPSSASKYCPLFEQGDWCHQVLRTVHDPSVERISQKVGLNRKVMPMIAQFYAKDTLSISQNKEFRIVRFLGETKHSLSYQVCCNENSIVNIEISKKQHTKKDLKSISKINVGEIVNFEVIKEINKNTLRVVVKK